ncbi:MAG: L,D-transpeptidase family protein, partial [Ilumatobacteraceae bacterium]
RPVGPHGPHPRRRRLAIGMLVVASALAGAAPLPAAARAADDRGAAAASDDRDAVDAASAGATDARRAATATATAVRGERDAGALPPPPAVANPALGGCDAPLLQQLMENDPTVSQWIIVVVPTVASTTGMLEIATVRGNAWQCTLAATTAQVGRAGIRQLAQRRSGDDTTPSGIFPLGVVTSPQGPISFFGNAADPGALGPYRRIRTGDCYGANPNTVGYGHWRVDSTTCVGDDELLERNVQTYEHAALIGANTEPNVSGDAPDEIATAAAIFLHRTAVDSSGGPRPTSGCVSIGHAQLVTAMRSIDPALRPHFAIGLRTELMSAPLRTRMQYR